MLVSQFIHAMLSQLIIGQTLPPVVIAMFLVAMWAWIDIEIKKMQPYIDLVHGDSPPQRSLLLDYTRTKCVITLYVSRPICPALNSFALAISLFGYRLSGTSIIWWRLPHY
jgi:hypothetical protein